ncbi:hypothetical protein KR49_00420 [Synechococcus sp. KORDI-49]|nr:hypothetical protein KR49_00420 [Synechococcus sp. KORDI-49]
MVMAGSRQRPAEDVVRTENVAGRGGFSPAPSDLESPGAGQGHHLVVIRAPGQGLTTLLIRFQTTH